MAAIRGSARHSGDSGVDAGGGGGAPPNNPRGILDPADRQHNFESRPHGGYRAHGHAHAGAEHGYDAVGVAAAGGEIVVTPELALAEAERVVSRASAVSSVGGKSGLAPASLDTKDAEGAAAAPEHPPLSTAQTLGIIIIATAAMSLSGAGTMSLSIALPRIMADLNVPASQLQWVSSAFSLTNGCFLLLAGRLADVYGRKHCFVGGVLWNGLWNLVGGFMPNTASLVLSRALAGVGSAFCIPAGIGIIAATFSGRTRSSAFAAFSAGGPIGGGLGLILGGLLTSYAKQTWRAALWTFGSVAFLVAIIGYFVIIPDRHLDPDRRVDWVGAGLITVGLVLLMFSISHAESTKHGWRTGYIIALIVISVALIAAFFFWEHYVEARTTRPPLMRLGLWTRGSGRLAATYLIGGVSWMGFTSLFYNATLFYQEVQGTGTIGAMLRFIPTFTCGLLCNVLVAKVIHFVPGQLLICVGLAATGLANVLFAIAPKDTIYWGFPFNAMWLSVVGADFLMAVGSVFVSTLAFPEEQSVAGAVFQTLVQLGGALGLAFVSVVQTAVTRKAEVAGDDTVTALAKGLHGAFWFAAGASFASLALAAVVLRGMGTYGKQSDGTSSADTDVSEDTAVAAGSAAQSEKV